MKMQYYLILFLVIFVLLIFISNHNREYFFISDYNFFTKRDIFKKNNLNPDKNPWDWFESNISNENKNLSFCFKKDYLKGLNEKMDKIVDVLVDKIIKLSITNTTESIHNLIPAGCLLSRFMLSYIKKKKTYMIYLLLNKINYRPGNKCSQKQKFIAKYIYSALQLGLNFKVENKENCRCDNPKKIEIPLNIDLIMKMITYPIKLNKAYERDLKYIYNICIIILVSYTINKNKNFDLTRYGLLLNIPIIYLQVMWDLITNCFSDEIDTSKRDNMFSYYLKNIPIKTWMNYISLDKLSSMFVIIGINFIKKHMNIIKNFPLDLLDKIKSKLEKGCVESFVSPNPINCFRKNATLTLSRVSDSDSSYSQNILSECTELTYLENPQMRDYKQDFLDNMFNFENCEAENEPQFMKYIYYYSKYLHHLKKDEAIDLFKKEFKQLKLSCKDNNDLWKLYSDSQNIIDGKEGVDKYFDNI